MDDRRYGSGGWWILFPLLVSSFGGLRAQCTVPPDLACVGTVNVTLPDSCRLALGPSLVLNGLSDCLGPEDFSVTVADGQPENAFLVDGPGRYPYAVAGRGSEALARFSCRGFVIAVDGSPPRIEGLGDGPLLLSCSDRPAEGLRDLPASVSRCYRVEGATGTVVSGSLHPDLRALLERNAPLPTVTDGCGGEVRVCVDETISATDVGSECDAVIRVVRTYTATQLPEEPDRAPAVSAREYHFLRPVIDELQGVEKAVFVDCSGLGPAAERPPPEATDYPYFLTPSGPLYLNGGLCQYQTVVRDGAAIPGCGDNYSFVRTFHVLDWCSERDTSFVQVVSVGDFAPPSITPPTQDNDFDGRADTGPLRFPTNTSGCAAVLNTRSNGVGFADGCGSPVSAEAYVFLNGRLENFPLGPYRVFAADPREALTAPIPPGQHLLRYVATDACGNAAALDLYFEVYDATPPTVVCRDGLTVSLDGNGQAVLAATLLDGGSADACGPLTLGLARANADGSPDGIFRAALSLTCADAGAVRVVLRGTDLAGIVNHCWLEVGVEDKLAPRCTAPADVALTCTAFGSILPRSIVADFAADPTATGALLDLIFGTATTHDNCPGDRRDQDLAGDLNNCGVGKLSRSFRTTDAGGFVSTDPCVQSITVAAHHEYSIRFPGDAAFGCGDLPTPEELVGREFGCDLLAVTTDTDTLRADAAGSCYELVLTHEVINWCEYNTLSAAIDVPRDPDRDGDLREPVFVNVSARLDLDLEDDVVILDRDAYPGNDNDIRPLLPAYGRSARRGYFRYRQFVSVRDTAEPLLDVPPPSHGIAFTQNCLGSVLLTYTATDDCGPVSEQTVEVDVDVQDLNGDGAITGADFRIDRDIGETRFSGTPEAGITVSIRNLPIGLHLARVRVGDGCGNVAQRFVPLTVEDGRAPTPTCIRSVTTNLSPDPTAGGLGVVWANDFVASPATTCTEVEIAYAIYTEAEALDGDFEPAAGRRSLDVDCGDLGDLIVRIYAFNPLNGRRDFCNAVLTVTDDTGVACAGRNGSLSGRVFTETGLPMEDIRVYNDGTNTLLTYTNERGEFLFDGLVEDLDYTVQPYENGNPVNGVTTRDITMIARYLLLVDDKLSAYQLIAADANRNREITIRDLIAIRRVILGIKDGFDNNTSWRFLPRAYDFPAPKDPFASVFPEVGNFNNLTGSQYVEFVGIKTGDLDRSATAAKDLPAAAGHGERSLLVWRPAATHSRRFHLYLEGAPEAYGLQFSIDLPAKTLVTPGQVEPEEYHLDENVRLHVSHAPLRTTPIGTDLPLLTVTVPAGADPPALVPDGLVPEAYVGPDLSVRGLELTERSAPGGAPVAGSVYPNPVRAPTTLHLTWPERARLHLTVLGPRGREVGRQTVAAFAGENRFPLDPTLIPRAAGVYLLRITGPAGRSLALRIVRQ